MSSGAPPAAIAVLRLSGPAAFAAGTELAGTLPPPRRAALRRLRSSDGDELDRALVLCFPGPNSATGEDLLEFHLHGGRAIVRAVEAALDRQPNLRRAEPGEFTRRALANGRIDLAQAEGLADLLAAETEAARRAALAAVDGAVSRAVQDWRDRLVTLSAQAEALIDFADEDDVPAAPAAVAALQAAIADLACELATAAARPPVDRLHQGIRVVLAGPPNSGKSSLINAMTGREVAIATPIAGTTRDRIEAAVVNLGIAYVLTDVAGLRDDVTDPIEAIGVARARAAIAEADVVIWLGDDPPPVATMLAIHAQADRAERADRNGRLAVSARTGIGISELWRLLAQRAADLLPSGDQVSFNLRQADRLAYAANVLRPQHSDLTLIAEQLRGARHAVSQTSGAVDTEVMLDALFQRFCIGK